MNSKRLNPAVPIERGKAQTAESTASKEETSIGDEASGRIKTDSGNLSDGKPAPMVTPSDPKIEFARGTATGRRVVLLLLFAITFASGLYFALVPNVHGDVFEILPAALRRWCGANDDLCNFLFFSALSFLTFQVHLANSPGNPARGGYRAAGRLAALWSLVVGLEIAQSWIPGRFSSFRDMLTGCGGVLVVWLCSLCIQRPLVPAQKKSTK